LIGVENGGGVKRKTPIMDFAVGVDRSPPRVKVWNRQSISPGRKSIYGLWIAGGVIFEGALQSMARV